MFSLILKVSRCVIKKDAKFGFKSVEFNSNFEFKSVDLNFKGSIEFEGVHFDMKVVWFGIKMAYTKLEKITCATCYNFFYVKI